MSRATSPVSLPENASAAAFSSGFDVWLHAINTGNRRLTQRVNPRLISGALAITVLAFLIYQCAVHLNGRKVLKTSPRRLSNRPGNCGGPNEGSNNGARSGNHPHGRRGSPTPGGRRRHGAGRGEGQDAAEHPWGPPPPYQERDPNAPTPDSVFGPPPPYSPRDPLATDEGTERPRHRPHRHGPPSPRERSGPGPEASRDHLVYPFPRIDDPQARESLNDLMVFFQHMGRHHHGHVHGRFKVWWRGIDYTIEVWERNLRNIGRRLEEYLTELASGFDGNPDAGFEDVTINFMAEPDGESRGDVGLKIHLEYDDGSQDERMLYLMNPLKALVAQVFQTGVIGMLPKNSTRLLLFCASHPAEPPIPLSMPKSLQH